MTVTGKRLQELAWLSNLIYEDWVTVREELDKKGFKVIDIWDKNDTQGMLVFGPGDAYAAVVFRGTEASKLRLRDIWANFSIPGLTEWIGKGRAHSGYARALERVAPDALAMAERVPPRFPLSFTGHSMGGALATEAASWYGTAYPGYSLALLATFGAPKSLDRIAGMEIKAIQKRFVMPKDLAPHWPLLAGLHHPSPEIRLTPRSRWPGPVSRHSAAGYAAAEY